MLEFETEEQAGYLYHDGDLGQYNVFEYAGRAILERITSDAAGPITENLGDFKSVSDAITEATRLEAEHDLTQADDRGNEK